MEAFIEENIGALSLIVLFVTVLKGLALWKAAQLSQKGWFIAMLFLNTLGILETIYILFISKKYSVEIQKDSRDDQRI
jgi:uncharacterized membrane protein YiaA